MAMASVTRSRRAELFAPVPKHHHPQQQQQYHHHQRPRQRPQVAGGAPQTRSAPTIVQQSNSTRSKRALESPTIDFDPLKHKRAKITVEILTRPSVIPPKNPPDAANATSQAPEVARATRTGFGVPAPDRNSQHSHSNATTVPNPDNNAINDNHPALTKHKEKVANGIRHELDRLQPSTADTKEEGRKLRSQEATRFKSELSAYFPDYDEVIGNDPKEEHILNIETPIVVVDSISGRAGVPPPQGSAPEAQGQHQPQSSEYPVRGYGDALFTDLFDSQRIDFSFLEARYQGNSVDDPLPDAYFEPSHKKAERLERSIRNSEKGRAQHEKDQIIRLLEGLQGPDWLRTMGVSGITESRKKTFEPAREHFIRGCKAILEKFRLWAVEEKRRKQEKERALAAEAKAREEESEHKHEKGDGGEDEHLEEEEEENEASSASQEDVGRGEEGDEDEAEGDRDDVSDGDPPDGSDVDASIAKQLREEVMARSKLATAKGGSKRTKKPQPQREAAILVEAYPQKEFTSFFRKRYQREAALSQNRRRGRTVVAWGQPVPEVPERDFDLPEEFRDEESLKAQARRRRRDRRGSRH